MHYIFFILSILVIGLSGIVAQVIILRELLINFYGNELSLGIILANWMILEAQGALVFGRLIDKIKNSRAVLISLELVFCLTLILSAYLARIFKTQLNIAFGQGLGLWDIFLISFLISLPVSFTHGALFSVACKIFPQKIGIGKVYTLEGIGTALGGIILTYLFIPYLNTFQIVWLICLLNLIICFALLGLLKPLGRYWLLAFAVLFLFFLSLVKPESVQRFSVNQQWQNNKVLDYRNSVYGNIAVIQKEEQLTFFYDGMPTITVPCPDITFMEEFGHLPLLFQENPKDILVIGNGAGGLINEILKHPVARLDYAEIDPLLISLLKRHPSFLTARELNDKRVKVFNLDGRLLLRSSLSKYDVILIGVGQPVDLTTNRFLTEEFFGLVKKRLNPRGLIAFTLPGSLSYLSSQLKDLNSCIINALNKHFLYHRVIPGDRNLILASDSVYLMRVNATLLSEKIAQKKIKTTSLVAAYLNYRLDRHWLDWFDSNMRNATDKINRDLRPLAVFEMLSFLSQEFSPSTAKIFAWFKSFSLTVALLAVLILSLILFLCGRKYRQLRHRAIAYNIMTTGFFGMTSSLILIFSFQVFYGYLYQLIGLLMGIFMAGVALASAITNNSLKRAIDKRRLFIFFELAIITFTLFLAFLLTHFNLSRQYSGGVFIPLFFTAGFITGAEFPLASAIYLGQKDKIGEAAGVLYFADLAGGWLAGILAGALFLPVLGLFNTCILVAFLKISSLGLLFVLKEAG